MANMVISDLPMNLVDLTDEDLSHINGGKGKGVDFYCYDDSKGETQCVDGKHALFVALLTGQPTDGL